MGWGGGGGGGGFKKNPVEVYENGSDVLVSGTLALHRKRDRGMGGGEGGVMGVDGQHLRIVGKCMGQLFCDANQLPVLSIRFRRRKFLYELNTSGKYFAFKEQLKVVNLFTTRSVKRGVAAFPLPISKNLFPSTFCCCL